MANQEHLKLLNAGVAEWNQWRNQNKSVIPDLVSADLRGFNLVDANLRRAQLDGANLSAADLRRIDLSMADLRKAKLNRADCRDAVLRNVDFRAADMRVADMRGADLWECNLSGANLSKVEFNWANLSFANLDDANLTEATLINATLNYSTLNNTNMAYATCGDTLWGDVDLSKSRNLEKVRHQAPSILGVNSLIESVRPLPDVFLRGCGISEALITFLPSMREEAFQFYSCFISYSHSDKSFAQRVHDKLQAQGIRCWLDEKQMNPGDDIYTEVDRGIRLWDKVLLCCSKSSLTEKWWVDQEIDKAFQKERDLMKERGTEVLSLIPLDVDGFLFSDEYTNPKASIIKRRIAADFKGWEHDNAIFEREIERVIKALRTDGGKEIPPVSKL